MGAAPALLALATVGTLAAADGGYFPSTWGWSALALLWVSAMALSLDSSVSLANLDRGMLVALFALAAWIAASVLWSANVSQTVLEAQRALVYVAGTLAVLLVGRGGSVRHLLGGVLVAIAAASAYGLATRLFPERLGRFDPAAVYRLAEPLGYWNALGILAAMGVLLALGFSAYARGRMCRALAAGSLVFLVPTLYFTFGRGPWIALGIALAVTIALDPRRLRLITTLLVVTPAPGLAVWLGSRSPGLTRQESALSEAARDGHRLALAILVLAGCSAVAVLALGYVEELIEIPPRVRLAYAGALVLLVIALLSAVFGRYGSPLTIARNTYDAFMAPPVGITQPGSNLNLRLFSFSGNGRPQLWRAAWEDYKAHPSVGSGAGTYEQYWLQHRPLSAKAIDAHSLYLEALAELGPIGVALLLVTLAIPLVAAVRARGHPVVPAASGAYLAYLIHAGVDWDWEMTVVTLTALFCGGALMAAAREESATPLSPRFRAGALTLAVALAVFAVIGLVGNSALAGGERAAAAGQWGDAEAEAKNAARWAPWSSEPWRLLAETQLARGKRTAARASLREAIGKEPRDWRLWYALALVTDGRPRKRAIAEATRLNPLSPELAELRAALGFPPAKSPGSRTSDG